MTPFYWIAVAAVVITSSARLTRLFTFDKFPPIAWARDKFADAMDAHERTRAWQLVAFCGYCFSFWATAAVVIAGHLSGVFDGKPLAEWMTPAWWLINGTLGASYLAAILMAHDGDESEPEDTESGDEPRVDPFWNSPALDGSDD